MECNKDEATRAKEISEKKFLSKDIAGAKKFALKAQNLYPDLDGISNMLATLDVYISAENKINGETDWYGILGVDPKANEQTIKKQYRKLALVLHPDKNKSIGCDGAFKLISEAWNFLSDKYKRTTYDLNRNSHRAFQKKVQMPPGGYPAATPPPPPSFKFSKKSPKASNVSKASVSAAQRRKQDPATASSNKGQTGNTPSAPEADTVSFWTMCHSCMTQHEYLNRFKKSNLACPTCREPFLAVELTQPPPLSSNGKLPSERKHTVQQQQKTNNNADKTAAWGPFSKPTNSESAAEAANMVKQTYDKVKRAREEAQAAKKREREEGQAAKKREEALRRKKNDKKGHVASKREDNGKSGVVKEGKGNDSTRGGPQDEFKSEGMMMEKARGVIRKQLDEWTENKRDDNATEEPVCVLNKEDEEDPTSIAVPDPDFHDFDKDRTESCFQENQVWAAYDDDDGMPRFYAVIHSVISLDPFKMRISWLNSRINTELGPIKWIDSGFSKTCGEFKTGKPEMMKAINSFSHRLAVESEGNPGIVKIYPKGDVWALYKNWSPEWNKHTEDEVIHKYEIVQVSEDYDEELGAVAVTPLVKVAGFKTVFRRDADARETRSIPRQEMFRFSHQIPLHVLTGEEAANAPKGCLELDPASTPSEYLVVIKEAESNGNQDEEVVDSGQKVSSNNKGNKYRRKKGGL
jgi:curved DNA-binding protein CbpA